MRAQEASQMARACRQQSRITANPETAAVLGEIAARYEALASRGNEEEVNLGDRATLSAPGVNQPECAIMTPVEELAVTREMEARHLALADRNIAEGEVRVKRQCALIERLETNGANTDAAEDFLRLLRQTLAGWTQQREMIIDELAHLPQP